MKSRTTINDIARELNITPATVSRALSDHPEISAVTKKRVREAAQNLDYHRNKIASSLRSGRTHLIGVLIPSAAHVFFGQVVHGITNLANDYGYDVLIYQSNETYENEVKGINAFLSARVDGILASISKETIDYTHFQQVIKQKVPLAFFDRINDDLGVPSVSVNDYKGAYYATMHLIEQGYKKIAHVAGQQHHKIFNDRLKGYMGALQANRLPYRPEYVFAGDITIGAGKEATKYFLQLADPPDAIFAVEDYAALGVITELKERSIKVPEEMGVIGFCNDLVGAYMSPSLSTIDQQTELMGQKAFQLIYEIIEHTEDKQYHNPKIVLDPLPVIRSSSKRKPS